jgi:hypothetical protein
MGCPCLRASVPVSLLEAMSTTFSALRQVRDVLHRERHDLGAEVLRLKEWSSLLKVRTKSKKEKAVKKREELDEIEVLQKEQVIIGQLNVETQKFLEQAKELLVEAEFRTNSCAKLEEELNQCEDAIS